MTKITSPTSMLYMEKTGVFTLGREKRIDNGLFEGRTMRYIDLFAGVGGFHYGIDRAYKSQDDELQITNGKHLSNSDNLQRATATCVYSNEWDKYANSVYRRHYGECDDRDIRTVPSSDIPDHDLLVGGFPCQAFSVAGKRGGFEDTRGTLFFEIARIVQQKRPRLLLLENVKGLLSHDKGKTFTTIISTLDELGYDVQWQVLNSKNFGVPQNRERVFIVGHLRGTSRPQVFPIVGTDSEVTQKFVGSIGTPRKGMEGQRHLSRAHKQPARVYDPAGISPTLSSQETQGRYNIVQLNHPTHSNDRVYASDEISPTLNTMQGGNRQPFVAEDVRIRRLTPLECERLQGFPDDFTKYGANGELISDTQRYKMMGNAVTTNVVSAIIRRLL